MVAYKDILGEILENPGPHQGMKNIDLQSRLDHASTSPSMISRETTTIFSLQNNVNGMEAIHPMPEISEILLEIVHLTCWCLRYLCTNMQNTVVCAIYALVMNSDGKRVTCRHVR